jgi:hypothetical protein
MGMIPCRKNAVIALLAVAAIVGCSAPPLAHDDLVLGNDTSKSKKAADPGGDEPAGSSIGDPEPEPDRPSSEEPSSPSAPSECAKDAECNQAGRICTDRKCVKGCRVTPDCPTNQTCTAGQCDFAQADVECYDDIDCDYGSICTDSACVPGCHGSYDCPTGQTCSVGQCQVASGGGPTPECTSDGQCNPGTNGAGKICSAQGMCVPGCHRDNQCPGAKICTSGMCH